jgi:hypothetical protein
MISIAGNFIQLIANVLAGHKNIKNRNDLTVAFYI